MKKTYDAISSLFEVIQKELKDEPEIIDIKTKAKNFKSGESILHTDFSTAKVFVIGCTSVGKSTLINKLIERNIYGCETLHGTTAFFYTTASSKSYEYFTINGSHEIKDVSILKSATRIDDLLEGYINIDTEIKTYLNSNNSGFLKSSFVIVDCPGLEQEENYKEKIINQCMHADIILFLFDVNQRARQQEMEFLKELYKINPNVCPYFVYNKCDTVNLNEKLMKALRDGFVKIFQGAFTGRNRMPLENLYFLSSGQTENPTTNSLCHEEFERLKNDILKYVNVRFIRKHNMFSRTITELQEVDRILTELLEKKNTRNSVVGGTQLNENKINETIERLKQKIDRECTDAIKLLKQKNMINKIKEMIAAFEGKCDKSNAGEMVTKMKKSINIKIGEKLQKHVNKHFYQEIKRFIADPCFSSIRDDEFILKKDKQFIDIDIDMNIFGHFASGDKTLQVKKHFQECILKGSDKCKDGCNEECNHNLSVFIDTIYKYYTNQVTQLGKNLENRFIKQGNDTIFQMNKKTTEHDEQVCKRNTLKTCSNKMTQLITQLISQLESIN